MGRTTPVSHQSIDGYMPSIEITNPALVEVNGLFVGVEIEGQIHEVYVRLPQNDYIVKVDDVKGFSLKSLTVNNLGVTLSEISKESIKNGFVLWRSGSSQYLVLGKDVFHLKRINHLGDVIIDPNDQTRFRLVLKNGAGNPCLSPFLHLTEEGNLANSETGQMYLNQFTPLAISEA